MELEESALVGRTGRQRGGPAVVSPNYSGFGIRYVKRSLHHSLGAIVEGAYPAEGAPLTMSFPIDR